MWRRAVAAHRWLLMLVGPVFLWALAMLVIGKLPPPLFLPAPIAVGSIGASFRCFVPRTWRITWWRPWDYAPRPERENAE
jgi:hypothetical protein